MRNLPRSCAIGACAAASAATASPTVAPAGSSSDSPSRPSRSRKTAKYSTWIRIDRCRSLHGAMPSSAVDRLYRRIYAVVREIPRGHVATYGQVAELAGIPGGARVAGAALKTSKPAHRLPWQRVIGKAGKLRGRIAIYD